MLVPNIQVVLKRKIIPCSSDIIMFRIGSFYHLSEQL